MNERERRKALVFLDYENIFLSLAKEGRVVDLQKLIELLQSNLNIIITGSFSFVPNSFVSDGFIKEFDEAGFYTIACPRGDKEKNKVDERMIEFAKLFYESSYVDVIVIISNDSDFSRLVNYFKHRGKDVIVVGTDSLSRALIKVADIAVKI